MGFFHIAFTFEDGIATKHETKEEARKAANKRLGRIAGVTWTKTDLGKHVQAEEKADGEGELFAILFSAAQWDREHVAECFGIDKAEFENLPIAPRG